MIGQPGFASTEYYSSMEAYEAALRLKTDNILYIEMCKDFLEGCGAALSTTVDHGYIKAVIGRADIPHGIKSDIALGGHVILVNLHGLTPEEELAIFLHEEGHLECGHVGNAEDWLAQELEADRYAASLVGPELLKSALSKVFTGLRERFQVTDTPGFDKRLAALTF